MLTSDASVNSFLTTCEEDDEGNLVLNFPDELLEAMGWGENTVLDISVVGDRIVLTEVERPDPGEVA